MFGENAMYTLETVESLHAYAGRLHRDGAQVVSRDLPRRSTMRALVRKVRRSA
jgi:hypothetical protein